MDRLLISLPVHERPDILAGQLANIRRYAPNALICVHVSASATAPREAFEALAAPGILITPESYPTDHGKGLLHAHIANFRHAQAAGERFDKMVLISSNELFMRPGLEAHVSAYALGAQIEMQDPAADWHLFRRDIEREPRMAALMKHFRLAFLFGGQAEGQFYATPIFQEIARFYEKHFPLSGTGFETEECVPQIVVMGIHADAEPMTLPLTLQNYCHDFEITPALVDQVRAGQGKIMARKHWGCLRSPHIGRPVLKNAYALKRVPREACVLRDYIYGLDA